MTVLVAESVSVDFGAYRALSDVSVAVNGRSRTGLIGPNGAGKTTLFNALLGIVPAAGSVLLDGEDVSSLSPHARARRGIGRTFQRIEIFPGLTVREHFVVAERARQGALRLRDGLRRTHRGAESARVAAIAEALGLEQLLDRRIETLTLGQCRLVEVGRALLRSPKVLLLDEPSSGLDRSETDALARTLIELQVELELAILVVEHDIDLVRWFVDDLYVLAAGRLLAAGPTHEVLGNDAVRAAYLGMPE